MKRNGTVHLKLFHSCRLPKQFTTTIATMSRRTRAERTPPQGTWKCINFSRKQHHLHKENSALSLVIPIFTSRWRWFYKLKKKNKKREQSPRRCGSALRSSNDADFVQMRNKLSCLLPDLLSGRLLRVEQNHTPFGQPKTDKEAKGEGYAISIFVMSIREETKIGILQQLLMTKRNNIWNCFV